jgi:hypothetical protein
VVFLPQYKDKFRELAIDGSLLPFIEDPDLQTDLGITIRLHWVKIIESIKKLSINFSASAIELANQENLNTPPASQGNPALDTSISDVLEESKGTFEEIENWIHIFH